jgi:hypothetical protein
MRGENDKMITVKLVINDVHKTVVVLREIFFAANNEPRKSKLKTTSLCGRNSVLSLLQQPNARY